MALPHAAVPWPKLDADAKEESTVKHLAVVGAVITRDGHVLCAQRGKGGQLAGAWEFPGGKLEPGEQPETALRREILEELDCVIEVGREVTTTTYDYDFARITLTTFWSTLTDGAPRATEHAELRWVRPADLSALEWAPADVPAVRIIEDALTS